MNEDTLTHDKKTVISQSQLKGPSITHTGEGSSSAHSMLAEEPVVLEGPRFVGHIFEFGKDPLAFMRRALKSKKPVVDFRVPGENISLITSASLSHQILVKHYEDFRKAERDVGVMAHVLGGGLVTNNDYKSHKKQRKLAQPGFHFRRIQSYAKTMVDYTESYSQSWKSSEVRDVNDDMFKLTLFIVSKTLFNNDMNSMLAATDEIGKSMHELQVIMNKGFQSSFALPSWVPMLGQRKLQRSKTRLINAIQSMIDNRTNTDGTFNSGDDLLSMLLEAEYEDGTKMPHDLLMDELITLLSAGHETTSNSMSWLLYLLAKNPDAQERVFNEVTGVIKQGELSYEDLPRLTYTEQTIKEAMRIYPPAWTLNTRQANSDVVIDGILFKKDKMVFIAPYANHFNPEYFPNPEQFDPERFSPENEAELPRYAYMPFGGGNRVCIGNSFAMMENKIILAKLIETFRFELCEKTKIEPQPQVTLSNKGGMWLKVSRR